MKLENLKTINQMVADYPGIFTENKLKHMARMRQHNGLEDAFHIVAGKCYVDPPALEKGLSERSEHQKSMGRFDSLYELSRPRSDS